MYLHVHHEQKTSPFVHPNNGVSGFIISRSIDKPEKRVEKNFCSLFEAYAQMLKAISRSLLHVPDKVSSVEMKQHVASCKFALMYCHCQYA